MGLVKNYMRMGENILSMCEIIAPSGFGCADGNGVFWSKNTSLQTLRSSFLIHFQNSPEWHVQPYGATASSHIQEDLWCHRIDATVTLVLCMYHQHLCVTFIFSFWLEGVAVKSALTVAMVTHSAQYCWRGVYCPKQAVWFMSDLGFRLSITSTEAAKTNLQSDSEEH